MIREGYALLGRERELASLGGFLATIAERPAALVLEGEPGIGKSALLGHAVDEARRRGGYRVLAARPTRSESQLSFVGLTDLLSDVRALFGELPSPQRRALEVALLVEEPAEVPPDPRAIGMGLLGVLRALTVSTPVLVVVDDIQWLDPPSAAALSFSLRRLTTEPVGLLNSRGGLTLRSATSPTPCATTTERCCGSPTSARSSITPRSCARSDG